MALLERLLMIRKYKDVYLYAFHLLSVVRKSRRLHSDFKRDLGSKLTLEVLGPNGLCYISCLIRH